MSRRPPIVIASVAFVALGCAGRPAPRDGSVGAPTTRLMGSLQVEVAAPESSAVLLEGKALLRTALFNDPREWPSGTPRLRVRSPFVDGRGTALFEDVPPGRYAVVAFVDLDGDGELDRGAFGVPTEPIAYGNDARPRFGPPSFEACVVEVGPGPSTVRLVLQVE